MCFGTTGDKGSLFLLLHCIMVWRQLAFGRIQMKRFSYLTLVSAMLTAALLAQPVVAQSQTPAALCSAKDAQRERSADGQSIVVEARILKTSFR